MTDQVKLLKRVALMSRQMGNLHGSLLFLLRGVDGWAKPIEKEAYLEHLKCDLSDLVEQCYVLALQLGLSWGEVRQLGEDRRVEALENFKAKGKLTEWV